MGITVTGLATDLPIDTWISKLVAIKQEKIDAVQTKQDTLTTSQSALSTVKTEFSSLLSALETITDSSFGSTSDLFAQKTASSSNSSAVSASVTALASKQSLSVEVSSIATATVAKSASMVSEKMSAATSVDAIADDAITSGDFSIYVDNVKYTISVTNASSEAETSSTLTSIMDEIESKTGLTAEVTDGKLVLSGSSNIVIGSNADTSNFATTIGLTGTSGTSNTVLLANTSESLTGTTSGMPTITAGDFMIGTATITVEEGDTLADVIDKINNPEDSDTDPGVTAYWDSGSGKLVLTSTTEGATNIYIEAGTSNFTDVMGLTSSYVDGEGQTVKTLADGSQTLGKNASFSINGTSYTSSTNTITSDISGIQGLTLTLSAKTTSAATVTVGASTTGITSALNTFVSTLNTVLADTAEATGSDGYLNGESILTMIRNNLRSTATAAVDDADEGYKTLASIGITSGKIGSTIDDDTDQLVIDSEKLAAALADDPESVKKLLIGDGETEGVLTKLTTIVEDAIDPTDGYFVTKDATYTKQIDDLQDNIDKQTTALEEYQTSLESKFAAMEAVIATLNSQLDTINAVIEQTKNND